MMTKEILRSFFSRIEGWIFLFFVLRCFTITHPPLESGHSWRQCTGLMVARNFHEVNSSIFYPRIDLTNGGNGIVAMEFPALNYLMAGVAELFGYDHWYGRLINLLLSSLGIWFFYRLVRDYFSEPIAFWSALFLLISIWFSFSRKTMADTFCISLFFIALHYGLRFLKDGGVRNVLLYFLFAALGVLSKIPAGIYAVLFLFPMLSGKWVTKRKLVFVGISLVWLSLVYYWYFVWNVHLSELGGSWYNAGMSLKEGATELAKHPKQMLSKFYFSAFSGYIFFGLFLAGAVFIFRTKAKMALWVVAAVSAVFFVYMLKSGFYFYHHNYYIIPFVPVMALVAAHVFLHPVNKKWLMALFFMGATESLLNQQHDFFIHDDQKYKLGLEKILDTLGSRDEWIAINGGGDPQLMYFAHRKGWTFDYAFASDSKRLERLGKDGAKWLVIDRKIDQRSFPFAKVYSDQWFDVYHLQP
jgi:hypothetical protein